MENNKNNVTQETLMTIEKTKSEKFTSFLKDNMLVGILFIVCAVNILRGIADIGLSEKTIWGILADSFISFAVGFTIKLLMGKIGIKEGLTAEIFVATVSLYNKKMDEIAENIEYLPYFTQMKNDEKLKIKQSALLLKRGLKYTDFKNGKYDDDPKYEKALKEVRGVECYRLSPETLTDIYNTDTEEKEIICSDTATYEVQKNSMNLVIGIVFAIIFGIFVPREGEFSWIFIMWQALQVGMYLILGALQYTSSSNFVTVNLRGKIIRIISYLEEFNNLIRKKDRRLYALIENETEGDKNGNEQ